jgi:hypothetical protein
MKGFIICGGNFVHPIQAEVKIEEINFTTGKETRLFVKSKRDFANICNMLIDKNILFSVKENNMLRDAEGYFELSFQIEAYCLNRREEAKKIISSMIMEEKHVSKYRYCQD